MLGVNVWRRVLGVDRTTVIEEIDFDEESETVVVHVRPRRSTKRRCPDAGSVPRVMTKAREGGTGGPSTSAR